MHRANHEPGRHLVQVQRGAGRSAADERGQSVVGDGVGEPDVELDAERSRDLVGEVAADGPPFGVDPAQQLALVPAERLPVIAVELAGLPVRTLAGQHPPEPVEVAEDVQIERGVDDGQPGLVSEQASDGDVLLAVCGELGPVAGHRLVELEQAAGMGDGHRHRRQPLGRREHADQGVALPRTCSLPIAVAAPQVDHQSAVAHHCARRADLTAITEVGAELVGHPPVALVDIAADLDRNPSTSRHPRTMHDTPTRRNRPSTQHANPQTGEPAGSPDQEER